VLTCAVPGGRNLRTRAGAAVCCAPVSARRSAFNGALRCSFSSCNTSQLSSNAIPHQAPVIGTPVFFVVSRSTFINDVEKLHVKGYDASGKDDAEVEEDEDFSDDEKARGIPTHAGWPHTDT